MGQSDRDVPSDMLVMEVSRPGGPENFAQSRRPTPRPGPRELLIRVEAAGINFPDVLQRRGLYDPPPGSSDLLGLEVSGVVVATGDGSARFAVGDRVIALMGGGGYAEYAVADERTTMHLPDGLDTVAAAALLESMLTVWMNVFQRGGFRAGETLLVHGGSSGIGTMATMLGKAFGASKIFTTVGDTDGQRASLALGADIAIDYRDQDFVAVTREATDGKGVDVIVDIIAGDYVGRNYSAAAKDGRIVQIGFIKGIAERVDIVPLIVKRLTHTGSTLRARTKDEQAELIADVETHVLPHIRSGAVKPLIHATFELANVSAAHELMDAGGHIGKIVLVNSRRPA